MSLLEIGPLLKAYRAKNSLKQKSLATILGISPAQASKLESGHHKPYGDVQLKILTLLVPTLSNTLLELEAEAETFLKERDVK